MAQDDWGAVDAYFTQTLVRPDAAIEAALAASDAAGLPAIAVAPNQGKLLLLLAQMQGARAILEIGTLGGYSTIWLARALPEGGRVTTLEVDPVHAGVARQNFARAGLEGRIELLLGDALETLPRLASENRAPFDFVFIDADKRNSLIYFKWALRLARPGAVIVVDNVVRRGKVADASSKDLDVQGVRQLNEFIASEPGIGATAIQTVGAKGYDGFLLARIGTSGIPGSPTSA